MSLLRTQKACNLFKANSVDAFIPEHWANESLAILEENMVASALIHRDFENIIAKFGDIVHTRKPGEFVASRKGNADPVTVLDATATDVLVPLNQWLHTAFMIPDGEESMAFKDLVEVYMKPAMLAQAQFLDKVVLGQVYRFRNNNGGQLLGLTDATAKNYLLDTREVMNIKKVYPAGRRLILTPNSETELLKLNLFISAGEVGDDGTALREASLGRKMGFDMFMCQNMSSVAEGNTKLSGAINNTGGYGVGATVLTTDSFTGAVVTGGWLEIDGDDAPQRITAHAETLGNTTSITISPGLFRPVADNAVINAYTPGAVNNGAGYPAGHYKVITVDGFTVAPKVGQLLSFGTAAPVYSVMSGTTTSVILDRPLDLAIADNDIVGIGPPGDYNFAFHRNALALVVRPLARPKEGSGAISGVVNFNDLSMRATITYQGKDQGHLVVLDMLFGIALLDEALGAVMLG
jgi:hypothetical protein